MRSWRRRAAMIGALLMALGLGESAHAQTGQPWWRRDSTATGLAPDPAATPEAVVQVYAARALGWRGTFGVHTWIVLKPPNAARYKRYEVIGFGVERGIPSIRVDRMGPDNRWFGADPEVILDRRGPLVEPILAKIEAAIAAYPYPDFYRIWPGPNSNTFLAHIGRSVPELGLDLPPTAIGKDFLPNGAVFAAAPSGTGAQVSLWGILGLMVAIEEGVELSLLGLTFGIDFKDAALKLPLIGRLEGTATSAAEERGRS